MRLRDLTEPAGPEDKDNSRHYQSSVLSNVEESSDLNLRNSEVSHSQK